MSNILKGLTDSISKAFRVDPNRGNPVPRKGLYTFTNSLLNKKQQRQFTMNSATLGRLANADPITWVVRRVLKGFISQTEWDIVPDTDNVEAELDRWEDMTLTAINPYGFDSGNFKSEVLTPELVGEVDAKIKVIVEDPAIDDTEKRDRIRWLFRTTVKRVKQDAESHKYQVKNIFEHPNKTETSFRALMEIVLDDVLVYDSGIIIKNYDRMGRLAELYSVPGQEIKIYRNEDGTAPEPPESAYVWENQGIVRAEYTNDELVYIMQNPQHNGYGKSPLEVAVYIITASLYADEYNIDYFKQSNVPPGIVNLGPDVSEDQRKAFQMLWDQEVQGKGGLHRIMFGAGSDKMQFIPMRNTTNRDMQMMEYLKWTLAIKCACYGLSPQDIGFILDFHRTVGEIQERLSQSRGVKSILYLIASYINEEIVKAEFPFKDVKFEWKLDDEKQSVQSAQIDQIDLNNGVITINDRRKKLGMKPIEGGDIPVIKSGTSMLPVEDLGKAADGEVDATPQVGTSQDPSSASQDPTADPNASQPQINGDPGRPTYSESQQESSDGIKVVVNRGLSKKEQTKQLTKTVESLKKQGINATIKIGFKNEDKK